MFELFNKGGFLMYPIFFSSLLAIAIFFERMFYLKSIKTSTRKFGNRISDLIRKGNINFAISACRKNISFKKLEQAFKQFLAQNNLAQASIKGLATIDLKKDERGIVKLAAKYNWPLKIIKRSEIKKVEVDLEIAKSDFVKKTIGVSAAAAPAAILASNSGQLIIDKTKYSGITMAAVEEEIRSE